MTTIIFIVWCPLYVAMKHANSAEEALYEAVKKLPDNELLYLASKLFKE